MLHKKLITFIISYTMFVSVLFSADHWYSIQLQGTKIGYGHTVESRDENGLRFVEQAVISLDRMGQDITIIIETKAVLDNAYRLLELSHLQDYGGTRTVVKGKKQDGKLALEGELGGIPFNREIDYSDGHQSGLGAMLAFRNGPMEVGRESVQKVFLEELMIEVPVKMKVSGKEQLESYKGVVEVFVLEMDIGGAVGVEKIDKEGVSWEITMPGMGFVMKKTTIEDAKELEGKINVAGLAKLKAAGKKRKPRSMRRMKARLTYKGEGDPGIVNDRRQIVSKENDRNYLVEISSIALEKAAIGDFESYLKPGIYEGDGDVSIIEKARELTTGINSARKKADRLNDWVNRHISDKNFSQLYASAPQVLQSAQGDCTEHSILFSALLKAAGVPSRPVVGLALMEGYFWYHEWVEALIGGEWRPYDPTFGQTSVDAAHIKLGEISSAEQLFELSTKLSRLLNNLEINVLEADY